MFKKRFLQGLAASSVLLVSLTITSFTPVASPLSRGTIDSRSPQHSTIFSAQFSPQDHLDCFRRYYNFSQEKSSHTGQKDASDYFVKLS